MFRQTVLVASKWKASVSASSRRMRWVIFFISA